MTTKIMKDLIFEAISSACKTIQDSLEVDDGGYAGAFFMDKDELENVFEDYIIGEISNKISEYDDKLDDASSISQAEKDNIKKMSDYFNELLGEHS